MFKWLHHTFVFQRRTKVLSRELSAFINPDTRSMLDIGSGDGTISKFIRDGFPQVMIAGIDTMARPFSAIPFRVYDGHHIPYGDDSFDVCLLVDVLHHLPHVKELLAEAARVSRKYILIKDHVYKNTFDFKVLKFMDYIGNKPHGVELTYNYLKEEEWKAIFNDSGLTMTRTKTQLPLYPFPFNILFGRKLHFISMLEIKK